MGHAFTLSCVPNTGAPPCARCNTGAHTIHLFIHMQKHIPPAHPGTCFLLLDRATCVMNGLEMPSYKVLLCLQTGGRVKGWLFFLNGLASHRRLLPEG